MFKHNAYYYLTNDELKSAIETSRKRLLNAWTNGYNFLAAEEEKRLQKLGKESRRRYDLSGKII